MRASIIEFSFVVHLSVHARCRCNIYVCASLKMMLCSSRDCHSFFHSFLFCMLNFGFVHFICLDGIDNGKLRTQMALLINSSFIYAINVCSIACTNQWISFYFHSFRAIGSSSICWLNVCPMWIVKRNAIRSIRLQTISLLLNCIHSHRCTHITSPISFRSDVCHFIVSRDQYKKESVAQTLPTEWLSLYLLEMRPALDSSETHKNNCLFYSPNHIVNHDDASIFQDCLCVYGGVCMWIKC